MGFCELGFFGTQIYKEVSNCKNFLMLIFFSFYIKQETKNDLKKFIQPKDYITDESFSKEFIFDL